MYVMLYQIYFTPYLSPAFTGKVKVKEISICEEIAHKFVFQVAILHIIFFKTNVFFIFFIRKVTGQVLMYLFDSILFHIIKNPKAFDIIKKEL